MPDDRPISSTAPARRGLLLAAVAAGITATSAEGQPRTGSTPGRTNEPDDDILDQLRVADLVQRERTSRDAGQWDQMAACWHPQSTVDVSWYNGDGAGFVAGSRRNAASGRVSLHQLAPTIVRVAGGRAIAETPCQLLSFVPVESIDMCMTGAVRLLWRAQRQDRSWRIAGLRMIYIRDYLAPCDPSRVPMIDQAELAGYRPSYRFLSYILARSPNRPRDDLPGIDRPEIVEALRKAEATWLTQV